MENAVDVIDVSVIMPSLNVEKFIGEALDSVIRQTLEKIEIICVDAGSTDGTREIIESYAAADGRIRFIRADKKSYGHQVNLGILLARGKYVGIVETDDFVPQEMYEDLYHIAEREDVDFVRSDFWGIEGTREKIFHAITSDANCYNRVVTLNEEGNLLSTEMLATWGCLYRKSFLLDYKILHNETLGASFQDTGFYMLSYMYSTRVYFTDKAYYRYRMDNATSSVHAKEKIFCICDEFEYVKKRIYMDGTLWKYKNLFCMFFYVKYKRNIERIGQKDREVFLQRFKEQFQDLCRDAWISWDRWNSEMREDLELIIRLGKNYLSAMEDRKKTYFKEMEKNKDIVIYGAGVYGGRAYDLISEKNRIRCFAVTEINKKDVLCEGVPVRQIDELDDITKDAVVLVAIKNEGAKRSMVNKAKEAGFNHIKELPYGLLDC